jgi:hypothetical protein
MSLSVVFGEVSASLAEVFDPKRDLRGARRLPALLGESGTGDSEGGSASCDHSRRVQGTILNDELVSIQSMILVL